MSSLSFVSFIFLLDGQSLVDAWGFLTPKVTIATNLLTLEAPPLRRGQWIPPFYLGTWANDKGKSDCP
jgi:hypothetical protein